MMNDLFLLGFYAIMGLVMTRINPGFKQSLIPAMVIFVAMSSMLLGLPGPLVDEREAGIDRTYKINGVLYLLTRKLLRGRGDVDLTPRA